MSKHQYLRRILNEGYAGLETQSLNVSTRTCNKNLKTTYFKCEHYCDTVREFNFEEYSFHINENDCPYADNKEMIDFETRMKEIKDSKLWFEITTASYNLAADWDSQFAICVFCKDLAKLDGYICYQCSAVSCKGGTKRWTKDKNMSTAKEYHPYGLQKCGSCLYYACVKIDRIPSTYDRIIKQRNLKCPVGAGGCKFVDTSLPYIQMLQHQEVCNKRKFPNLCNEIDERLDPKVLNHVVYINPAGTKVCLIDPNTLQSFKNTVNLPECIDQDIKIGAGFKVCLMRDTNEIFIVGGLGTETKTFVFNSETNMIESHEAELKYQRLGHSLCSYKNTLICTGSSIVDQNDSFATCRRVEIYKPEWGCWKEGVSMNEDRCDHFSVCINNTIYAVYGKSPKYDTPQEGIESISFDKVYNTYVTWTFVKNLASTKMNQMVGFLPYPYSEKFIIFGSYDSDSYDSDEDTIMQYNFNAENVEQKGLTKRSFDDSKHNFDMTNMPFYYMGIFYVFGKDGSTVYKCEREFEF